MQPFALYKEFGSFCEAWSADETAHLAFLDHCEESGLHADCADALRKAVRAMWKHEGDIRRPVGISPTPYLFLELLAILARGDEGWDWSGLPRVTYRSLWEHVRQASDGGRFDLVRTLRESGYVTDTHFMVKAPEGLAAKFDSYKRRPKSESALVDHRFVADVQRTTDRQAQARRSETPAALVGFRGDRSEQAALLFDPATGITRIMDAAAVAYCRLLAPGCQFHLPLDRDAGKQTSIAIERPSVPGVHCDDPEPLGYVMPRHPFSP